MSKASGSIDLKSLKIAGEGASKYITYISSTDGIRVYDGDSSNKNVNFAQINSSGMQVYKGGIASDNKVAEFGETVTIGKESNACIIINAGSITGYGAYGQSFFNFASSGTSITTTHKIAICVADNVHNLPGNTAHSKTRSVPATGGTVSKIYCEVVIHGDSNNSQTIYEQVAFTIGTAATKTVTASKYGYNITVTATYDGDKTLSNVYVTSNTFPQTTQVRAGINLKYLVESLSPCFEIGDGVSATGAFAFAEGHNTIAQGEASHAEGDGTQGNGNASHAEGYNTIANLPYSHAEGYTTQARGNASHAEGYNTIARGYYSHAEGYNTTASGEGSHAEGFNTTASNYYSHAEGYYTTASGRGSHAEGIETQATGDYSHAAGIGTQATASFQTVFGKYNIVDANASLIIGNGSENTPSNIFTIKNTGDLQIKDGFKIVNGTGDFLQLSANNLKFFLSDDTTNAIAQFGSTIQIGKNTAGQTRTEIDANGMRIIRKNDTTDVQIVNLGYGLGNAETGTATAPYYTLGIRLAESAIGNYSVAEGGRCVASGSCSHAEGFRAEATGYCTHAEGYMTGATLDGAHAEGAYTNASGAYAHAEGYMTGATGQSAHAEGRATVAQGRDSHAGGDHTTATTQAQTVIGGYNELDTGGTAATRGDYAFIIGNGTSTTARSNALMVDWDGYIYPQATKMTDFVVEQGTDGIWTYRKWNSGIAECWGRYSVTLTKYTTVSSFAGYTSTVNFPSGLFISGQIPTHTYVATVGNGFTMSASGMGADNTKMNVYALATASANNQNCVFDIIAKGRWK